MPLPTLPHAANEPAEITIANSNQVWTDGSAQLIDVSEQSEWDEAHIDGAILIPLGQLMTRLGEIDLARPVVTICRSGVRSLTAAEALAASGVSDVASMQGGMIAWIRSGYPCEP